LKYWGSIILIIEIGRACDANYNYIGYDPVSHELPVCPDPKIKYSEIINNAELNEKKLLLIFNTIQKIRWAYGADIDEKQFKNYMEKLLKGERVDTF